MATHFEQDTSGFKFLPNLEIDRIICNAYGRRCLENLSNGRVREGSVDVDEAIHRIGGEGTAAAAAVA